MLRTTLLILTTFVIVGCAQHAEKLHAKPFAPDSNKSASSLANDLRSQGVQVIHLGQKWRFVLSTDHFFQPQSTRLKDKYTSTMIPLATLIKKTARGPISVVGYTDNLHSKKQRLQLGKQYANTVAAYLWAQGITYNQLRIIGAGNMHRVATNKTSQGKAFNRRVEIKYNS